MGIACLIWSYKKCVLYLLLDNKLDFQYAHNAQRTPTINVAHSAHACSAMLSGAALLLRLLPLLLLLLLPADDNIGVDDGITAI